MAARAHRDAQHLDHEEAETEQLYLAKRDPPEPKAMSRKLARGPRPRMGVSSPGHHTWSAAAASRP
jgi:hypothetical protein